MKTKLFEGNLPMRKYCLALLCIATILWTGCSVSQDKLTETPEVETATQLPSATPAFTTTPSPTITQTSGLKIKCLEISPDAHQDLEGLIVLSGGPYRSSTYLLEVSNGQKIQLLREKFETLESSFAVSPDGEW